MDKEYYKRKLEDTRKRKQQDKIFHQNKINNFRKDINAENERYSKVIQNYAIEEERIINAMRACSNEEYIEIQKTIDKLKKLCEGFE